MTTHHAAPLPSHAILSAEEVAMLTTYMAENRNWSFEQVAQDVKLPAELLRKLVRDGVLEGAAPWRADGVVGTCNVDQARQIAAQLNAARAPVDNIGISAYDAAEKYKFNPDSIYNWHKNGWVKSVGARQFNEGDIAFARALADLTGHASGKPVFPAKPRSGRPKSKA